MIPRYMLPGLTTAHLVNRGVLVEVKHLAGSKLLRHATVRGLVTSSPRISRYCNNRRD